MLIPKNKLKYYPYKNLPFKNLCQRCNKNPQDNIKPSTVNPIISNYWKPEVQKKIPAGGPSPHRLFNIQYLYGTPARIPTIVRTVSGSTTCASTRPTVGMKSVQKTFLTCSFLPNASSTASVSVFMA